MMEKLFSSAQHYKDGMFKQLARIGKSLSSDKRLEILNLLVEGPKTVNKLAKDTGMNVANVSRHLQVLSDSRLVTFTKEGTYAIYSLADPSIADFMYTLWRVGENQLSDMTQIKEDFYSDLDSLPALQMDEVYEKLKEEDVIVLDLRPSEEYEAGHIEGAISVPMEELDTYLEELPKDKEIIAYCRGRYCAYSPIAAQKLKNEGYMAHYMAESLYEWQKYLDLNH